MMKLFNRNSNTEKQMYSNQSEIEQITTELIAETKDSLDKKFNKLISLQQEKLLSREDAENILVRLIKEAIANRKLIIGRIEKDVERGQLFNRYYGKMQVINALTNKAYIKLQKMEKIKEKYEFKAEMYKKMTNNIYDPTIVPDDSAKNGKAPKERKDIWEYLYHRNFNVTNNDK